MSFPGKYFPIGIYVVCVLLGGSNCLELKIEVPRAVLKGRDVVLKCFFDLEGDKLYSVKWYHNSAEFYRYTLTGKNSAKPFNLRGFHVDQEKSNSTQVVLKHATKAISGRFSCEVTVDQPSFFTSMETAVLEVVEPPQNDPIIVGLKSKYKIGDYIKAICSADRSEPAVNLTWYMNGRPIEGPHIRKYKKNIEGNYISSQSTLQIGVTEQLFDEGKLKLRCIASIHDVWQRTVDKSVELKRPKPHIDQDSAPAWVQTTTTTTESTLEKYWLYIARDNTETNGWSENKNSSSSTTIINKALLLTSIIFYMR